MLLYLDDTLVLITCIEQASEAKQSICQCNDYGWSSYVLHNSDFVWSG